MYLFAGVMGVMFIQSIILLIWTLGGPQQAVLISGRTYYFYACESVEPTFNAALSAVTIIYNFMLLAALLFLAYKTRTFFFCHVLLAL